MTRDVITQLQKIRFQVNVYQNIYMSFCYITIWMFPKIGVPQNGWFIWKTLLKWMIWGYHHFRKPPYIYIYIYISPVFFPGGRFLKSKHLAKRPGVHPSMTDETRHAQQLLGTDH